MMLVWIPLGLEPPGTSPPGLVEAGLQHTQQGQGDQLDLEGSQNRLFGPGPAFLHTQALLVIAEPIFLPESRRPGFHHLGGRQIQG
jgi:hypothetical protein